MNRMERVDRIWNHEIFQDGLNILSQQEKDRRYCKHGLPHLLDVARIAYILNLERGYHLDKECIYAMALLHDLGRSVSCQANVAHRLAGIPAAKKVLSDCGFTDVEMVMILQAIEHHGHSSSDDECKDMDNPYVHLLSEADRRSRACYQCEVKDTCYWTQEEKNHEIVY